MEVHRQLGYGFLEAVYQEALGIELNARGIPATPQVELPIYYRGQKLQTFYRADFVCYDVVIVELKAHTQTGPHEEAQVINYLKATNFPIGFLLNFGTKSLKYRRFILSSLSASSVESADDF